jgi:hypothetical protein
MKGLILLLCAGGAWAGTLVPIAQPNPGYIASSTLLTIPYVEGDIIGSVADSNLTISFRYAGLPTLMDVDAVPDSWATWGSPPSTESSTPMVLAPDDPTQTDLVFQFSQPLDLFGVELEPDDIANSHVITATYLLSGNPVGTIQQNVNGNGGALLFAASGGPFDSVEVTSDIDFAAAEFRYAEVPEPSTALPMLGVVLLAYFRAGRSQAGPAAN